jgi:hypothetical protein
VIATKILPDDPQTVFNWIVAHLREQGQVCKSGQPTSYCAYHNKEGLACAAGCLLPTKEYHPSFEGESAKHIPFFARHFPKSLSLIVDCQYIHDECLPQEWDEALTNLAAVRDLSI